MRSRIARNPITVPAGVTVTIKDQVVNAKGPLGELTHTLHPAIQVNQAEAGVLTFAYAQETPEVGANAQAGTARALVNNMVIGVSQGFSRKLVLVGVGYRAKASGKQLDLSLGFSHPVNRVMPEGLSVEVPTPTEIILKGIDKQRVNQMAAKIRALRPPEPYKGKGIRYDDETIILKEGKKK